MSMAVEPIEGIEPPLPGYEAGALPLELYRRGQCAILRDRALAVDLRGVEPRPPLCKSGVIPLSPQAQERADVTADAQRRPPDLNRDLPGFNRP